MKSFAKKFVLALLTFLARRRIKHATTVIGITGSVGKTTTKEALQKILTTRFRVHANQKSFNSEFGVPLTLLEEESGYSSARAWLGILVRGVWKSFRKLSAEKIILELGVDHPGDMSALLRIIRPSIGIITAVAPVHLARGQFQSVEEIAQEKGKLIQQLPANGFALVNADDPLVVVLPTSAQRITFGIQEPADLSARNITETSDGISAELVYSRSSNEIHSTETAQLTVPILGVHNLYSLLAALAGGIVSGVNLNASVVALADFQLPPGRLNLLAGINGSTLIDGSYNSNPASLAAALETFGKLNSDEKMHSNSDGRIHVNSNDGIRASSNGGIHSAETGGRKIALLGQMNELGAESIKQHRILGERAAEIATEIIGVFGDAREFVSVAEKKKIPARFFETAEEAGEYLKTILKPGDLVLAKGSQNKVRLEKALVKMLAEPARAKELLCRQEKY